MNRILLSASILVFSFVTNDSFAQETDEPEFIDMFASGDLNEWRVGKKGTGWSIAEGVIRLDTPKSGSLMSRKKYKDFELRFDWKISEGGNSGIIYRAQKGRGVEYQTLDDERHIRGKDPIWSTAALYDLVPPKQGKIYHSAGQWNSGRIVARGNHIEHWLNGEKVLEIENFSDDWNERYRKSKHADYGLNNFANVESPIVFQDHGHEVAYRNVRLREFEPTEPIRTDTMDFPLAISQVPMSAKFIDDAFYIWGGSMVKDTDGKYHLLYSRWPRDLQHSAWVTHSEIAHAVADSPLGPFKHVDVALPMRGKEFWDGLCTHNPTVHEFDGKYYLYYMGNTGDHKAMEKLNWNHRNNQRVGVAVADHPAGPWKRFDSPLIDVSPNEDAADRLMTSNPSILRRSDGTFVLIYKAVGTKFKLPMGGPVVHLAATSDSPTGPFKKQMKPLFTIPGVRFPAEDPYIWSQGDTCWAIVNDHKGAFTNTGQDCLALFTSDDGLRWRVADNPLVLNRQLRWKNGKKQTFHRLERPQLYLENGIPKVLLCAAEETKEKVHSFNVQIPLEFKSSK